MKMLNGDYFWNTLGAVLQSAISPLLLLVVTRANGIEAAGLFSFAFAVSLLMWSLAMWGGRTFQVSDAKQQFNRKSYIMVRLLLAIAVLVITGVFCLANGYEAYRTGLIFALVVFKILESFADVIHGILQVHDRLYVAGQSLAAKAIIGFVVFTVVTVLTNDMILASAGVVLVNVVLFAFYDIVQVRKYEQIWFSGEDIKKYFVEAGQILWKSAGVFVVFFLTMFSLNIPRYFIDNMRSQEEVGYFGVIAMPITLLSLLVVFILQPNIVRLSKLYADKKMNEYTATVRKILLLCLAIGGGVLLATALVGVPLLRLVFDVDFTEYRTALIVIMAGGVASALLTVYLNHFVIARKIAYPLAVLVAANILLTPASFFAVEQFGVDGGAWAYMFALVLRLVFVAFYAKFAKATNEKAVR